MNSQKFLIYIYNKMLPRLLTKMILLHYALARRLTFLFFLNSFNLWRPLVMITLYHHDQDTNRFLV